MTTFNIKKLLKPSSSSKRSDSSIDSSITTNPRSPTTPSPSSPPPSTHRCRTEDLTVGNSIQTTPLDEDEIDNLIAHHRQQQRGGGADSSAMEALLNVMARAQETNKSAMQELNSSIRALATRMEGIDESGGRDDYNNRRVSFQNDDIQYGHAPVIAPPQAAAEVKRSTSCLLPRRASDNIGKEEEGDNTLDRRAIFARMHARQKPDQQHKGKGQEDNEEDEVHVDVDRVSIRLDGVEVYAVVSAITLATAVSSFEIIDVSQWSTHVANRDIYHMLIIILNLISGTVGIVAGLHSIIIFSLITMYGRTSVGLSHDDAYDTFFATTALQRVRGFRMFLLSMYAFMVQVVILIESRCPVVLKPFMILFALWLLRIVHEDTQGVIKGAECIFQHRKGKDGKKTTKRPTVGGVAMHGTSRSVLAASSRQLLETLSRRDIDGDEREEK